MLISYDLPRARCTCWKLQNKTERNRVPPNGLVGFFWKKDEENQIRFLLVVPRGGIEPPTPAFSVPHALFLHDPALAPQSRKLLSRLKSARPHFPRKPSVAHGLGTMTVPLLIFQTFHQPPTGNTPIASRSARSAAVPRQMSEWIEPRSRNVPSNQSSAPAAGGAPSSSSRAA